jgi:hypothetical protein
MSRIHTTYSVAIQDFFAENVVSHFPSDLIGKLAMVSKVYLEKCRERVRKEERKLMVSVAALQTPDDVCWALQTLESMRMADVPHYDKRAFFDALASGGSVVALETALRYGCKMSEESMERAAGNGHTEVLKWLHANNCPRDIFRCLEDAAGGGHVHVLEWFKFTVIANDPDWHDCFVDTSVAISAACGNRVDVLNWLKQHFPWCLDKYDPEVAMYAALSGSMWALQWLHKMKFNMSEVCGAAAKARHFHILRWARSKGFPWSIWTCNWIAGHGDLETLKWAIDTGCRLQLDLVLVKAIKYGHMHIVDWLLAKGAKFSEAACAGAAKKGRFDALKWLRSQGCPWDHRTCDEAARRGDLEMLMWVREKGCPWGCRTYCAAEASGDLKLMRWARANGCPWKLV